MAVNNKTVLVIDDDQDFLAIAEEILTRANYKVRTASSGEQALEDVQETAPDVIVCDVNMPKMSGLQFIEQLRQGACRAPVMLITAGVSPVDFHSTSFKADAFCLKQNLYKRLIPEVEALAQ